MKNKASRLRFTAEEQRGPAPEQPTRRPRGPAGAGKAQPDRKKRSSRLSYLLRDAPADTVAGKVHAEIRESEEDNVGVESAHKTEQAAETSARLVREGRRSRRLRAARKAKPPAKHPEGPDIEAPPGNIRPEQGSVAHRQQKQSIKKQYAAARRAAQNGKAAAGPASGAGEAVFSAVRQKAQDAGAFIVRHKAGLGIAGAAILLVMLLLNTMSSCSMMAQSIGSVVSGATFPSRDADMLGAEAAYAEMETELQSYLDNYESTHDYDEYHFDLDEIGHDPYVLMSLLTALHGGEWTLTEVRETLDMLFDRQYILAENVVTEERTRTEVRIGRRREQDPITGEVSFVDYEYEAEVPYSWRSCYVTLDNFDLSHLPIYLMDENGVSMYAMYIAVMGNRPDLFPQAQYPNAVRRERYLDYDVPPEALADAQFAAMLQEAEKYLGYPYVWGGSHPFTSFDCSGFVSWVINHSGWNVGRLTAQGLCNICTPVSSANARPGDLVFFVGTYDTPGVSHVGIYVGNSMMLHCGDPISYTNLNANYWQQHFYTFGRLP